MKTPILLLTTLAATLSLAFAVPSLSSSSAADEEAVRAAVEDYCMAFYHVEPERIERSVSPDMKKMGYWRDEGATDYSEAVHMTFEQAVALASKWNVDNQRGEDLEHSIELYEVADKTACAKLTAYWGIDYMQLAKESDGRWRIHHVMWQSHPRQDG